MQGECKEMFGNYPRTSKLFPGKRPIHHVSQTLEVHSYRQVFKAHDRSKIMFAPAYRASYIKPCSSTSMIHLITIKAQS